MSLFWAAEYESSPYIAYVPYMAYAAFLDFCFKGY